MVVSDSNSDFNGKGERRRLKAATLLLALYTFIILLHLAAWGAMFVVLCSVVLGAYAGRLLAIGGSFLDERTALPVSSATSADDLSLPSVSILVAAKNEEAVIASLVQELHHIDYPRDRLEFWVVDDNSSDRTPTLLEGLKRQYPQLKTLRRGVEARGGKSGALNQVMAFAKGDIIGVFDADARIPAEVLQQVVPLFGQPQVGAVQLRKSIANADVNFWTRGQAAEMALDSFLQTQRILVGGLGELRGNGQFVRRTALERCGGWNEATITDDLDMTFRLHLDGWDILCPAYPAVGEEGVTRWWQLWHQRNRWAEGGYQRYLDYWSALVKNRMGTLKTLDMAAFFLIQYAMPAAALPDCLTAIALERPPLLTPLVAVSVVFSAIAMARGIRRAHGSAPFHTLAHTLLGTLYMLHWIPVMAAVTHRLAIRPKRLKWVKTVHQGMAGAIALDLEELDD